ncbi:MAG: HIT family protein [Alteraurantiacibacter sp.]|nr:HIT family protein [Alteraurantiacibacter sp.]
MHATAEKFGWPASLVAEFQEWLVLARPAQPTLGSLVLVAKSDATAFGDLPAEAHAELKAATSAIEAALARAVNYAKINYLMLMMVDPQVHFHVIPRYEGGRQWGNREFVDVGWPKVPELGHAVQLEGAELVALTQWLKGHFA